MIFVAICAGSALLVWAAIMDTSPKPTCLSSIARHCAEWCPAGYKCIWNGPADTLQQRGGPAPRTERIYESTTEESLRKSLAAQRRSIEAIEAHMDILYRRLGEEPPPRSIPIEWER